jgi:predicted dehydrogenase
MTVGKARIGVVGAGWWSTYTHIPGLLENPDAYLAGICDTNEAAGRRVAEAFPDVATYSDLGEMLQAQSLDGVVVAVPHVAHHSVAAQCLDQGLHVMLEKPMTLTAVDARDLVQRAEARGVELIVGYPFNFTRTAIRARDLLASGELGRIEHVQCMQSSMVVEFYRGNDAAYQPIFDWTVAGPGDVYARPELSGGGQGHLQITHSSGLMFFVTGLRAARVGALMSSLDVPVDVVDAMTVEFDGGALGVVGGTGNIPVGDDGKLDLHVYCERGYVLLDAIRGDLVVHPHEGSNFEDQVSPDDPYPRFDTANNLVDVCRGDRLNGSPGEIGLRSVEMLDAAYRSADRDGAMVGVRELYA